MADVRNPRLKLGQTLIDFCFSRIVDIINSRCRFAIHLCSREKRESEDWIMLGKRRMIKKG